jgi:hypothetical protein
VTTRAIQKNNERARDERMPLARVPGSYVQCQGCLRVHSKRLLAAADFRCHECGDQVCAVCGCTDSVACEEGCSWLLPGLCSTHGDE